MTILAVLGIVVGWLACSWAACRISIAAWLYTFDLTRREQDFFRIMSIIFGPLFLVVGVYVWLISRPSPRDDIVVKKQERH